MDYLFRGVLEASIQGSIVAVVLIICKKLFNKKLSARHSFLISMILIVRLLLPFSIESDLSIFNIFNTPQRGSSIQVGGTESGSIDIEASNSSSSTSSSNSFIPSTNESTYNNENDEISTEVKGGLLNSINEVFTTINNSEILPFIWAIFAANILCWMMFSNSVFQFRIRRAMVKPSNRILYIYTSTVKELGMSDNIKIGIQDVVDTPFLMGVLRPKIALPNYIDSLDDKEVRYVVLHELMHYKRKDNILNYVLVFLQGMHWFNPIMYYYFKLIRKELELATDEKVMSILTRDEHIEYGNVLLKVLDNISSKYKNMGFVSLANNKKDIFARIKNIKDNKMNRKYVVIIGVILCVILSATLLTSKKIDSGKDASLYGSTEDNVESPKELKGERLALEVGVDVVNTAKEGANYVNSRMEEARITLSDSSKHAFSISLMKGEFIKIKTDVDYPITIQLKDNVTNEYVYNNTSKALNGEYVLEPVSADGSYELMVDINDLERAEFQVYIDDTVGEDASENSSNNIDELKEIVDIEKLNEEMRYYTINKNPSGIGEFKAYGNIDLGYEVSEDSIKIYSIVSYSDFGFENDVFTIVSGSAAIPIVYEFEKDSSGNYYLSAMEEAKEGGLLESSVKEMFPEKYVEDALNSTKYISDLQKMQEGEAEVYLEGVGIDKKVDGNYREKEYLDVDSKVLDSMGMMDGLIDYPTYIGSREDIVNGLRTRYEVSQNTNGETIELTFTKYMGEGTGPINKDTDRKSEKVFEVIDKEPYLIQK